MGLSGIWMVLIGLILAVEAVEQRNMTVSPGEEVILSCTVPHGSVSEWDRKDLGSEYILLYRDGHLDPEEAHPAFKGRVTLKDKERKNGEFSMILTNVKPADSGTYVCRVYHEKIEVLNTINLLVSPGPTGEKRMSRDNRRVGLIVLLLVIAVILIVGLVAGIASYKKKQKNIECPEILPL